MKMFKDLEFKAHRASYGFDTQARLDFSNGYGVSVITGSSAYTSNSAPYEVAIMYKGSLTYNTDITDDVLGHQSEEDVTDVMKRVQELKN